MIENITEEKRYATNHKNWQGAPVEKRSSPWRYNEETLKYNNKPIDKDYFKNYMAVRVPCPNCGKQVLRGDMSKHKKRAICINNSNNNN